MSNDSLTTIERLALRTFDQFCSPGRPHRLQDDEPQPDLQEVTREELFAAYLCAHPTFRSAEKSVLARLPDRARVYVEWWNSVKTPS